MKIVRVLMLLAACNVLTIGTSGESKSSGTAPWIDKYGQNTRASYPGYIRTDAQLKAADSFELQKLRSSKSLQHRDKYQGWIEGNKLRASGFFRVEKIGDRWWLVTPEGNRFYASGINCVDMHVPANLKGESRLAYQWLPPNEGVFADARNGSLYTANLIRKWGDKYKELWRQRAVERLKNWGFTCIGNWSDGDLLAMHKLPYVHVGPSTGDLSIPYVEGDICDVYDPRFEQEASRVCTALSSSKSDPWLVGYFVDNELPWWNLGYDVLGLEANAPSKQVWLNKLKQKYGSIDKLNRAWRISAKSFETVTWPGETAPEPAQSDLKEFRGEFAERFYKIWYQAIKRSDPNHLVLGSRIPYPMDEVVLACARHCDVLSFNHYATKLWPQLSVYYKQSGKSVLVGEYGFDSLDEGLVGAYVRVANQKERGAAYSYLTEQMAAQPYFVGSFYFQYIDEPLTGRSGDGENEFNGFVKVTDIPYLELVNAARKTNFQLYEIHAGKRTATTRSVKQLK